MQGKIRTINISMQDKSSLNIETQGLDLFNPCPLDKERIKHLLSVTNPDSSYSVTVNSQKIAHLAAFEYRADAAVLQKTEWSDYIVDALRFNGIKTVFLVE